MRIDSEADCAAVTHLTSATLLEGWPVDGLGA